MWGWRRMEKTNEQVLERTEEKRTLLNNILPGRANWIGHFLRGNCLRHDAIEGHGISERGRKKNTAP